MKTAISIPNDLYAAAEAYARKAGLSRSELYRRALHGYLKDQGTQDVTAALDSLYGDRESGALHPLILHLQEASVTATDDGW